MTVERGIALQVVLPDLLAVEESHDFFPRHKGNCEIGPWRLMDFVSFPLEFDRPIRINSPREMKREDGIHVLMTGGTGALFFCLGELSPRVHN